MGKEPTFRRGKARNFVIQKHYARNLHYDFRLAFRGVLKSWAVPKGISKSSKDKRLAIEVEDHKLSYAKFEGEIPEGQYGAGKVEIYDAGLYYHLTEDEAGKEVPMKKALQNGHLEIDLQGSKIRGIYVLHRFKDKNWLIIKKKA